MAQYRVQTTEGTFKVEADRIKWGPLGALKLVVKERGRPGFFSQGYRTVAHVPRDSLVSVYKLSEPSTDGESVEG